MKIHHAILFLMWVSSQMACSVKTQSPPKRPLGKNIVQTLNQDHSRSGSEEDASGQDPNSEVPSGTQEGKKLGNESDDTRAPKTPVIVAVPDTTVEKQSKDPPSPAQPPAPPPPPPSSHQITVDCNQALNISFRFGGRVQPFRMSGGTINGQPSSIVTNHCPKIKTALDQKGFPLMPKPPSKPTGGEGLSVSCAVTTLRFNYISGNPGDGGTGVALQQGVDIESVEVCLEIRDIINGLMLQR